MAYYRASKTEVREEARVYAMKSLREAIEDIIMRNSYYYGSVITKLAAVDAVLSEVKLRVPKKEILIGRSKKLTWYQEGKNDSISQMLKAIDEGGKG